MKKKSLKEIKEKAEETKYSKKIVKKNTKKKDPNLLIKLSIFLLLILFSLIAYIICGFLPSFEVKTINVNDAKLEHYTKEDIIASIRQDMYANIVRIDIADMQNDIYKLPYVKTVKINKLFPTTLEIIITEKEPTYVVKYMETKYMLLDENFKVLEILDNYNLEENQYLISGIELEENLKPNDILNSLIKYQFKTATKIKNKFNERVENRKLSTIDFENKQITIGIDSNITVKISNSEDFDYQMRYLNQIMKTIENENVFIDMTSETPYSKEVN